MREIVKVCPVHGDLTVQQVYEDKTQVGFLHRCTECRRQKAREYRLKNIEKIREYDRQRGKERSKKPEHKAIVRKAAREWRRRNADEVNAKVRQDRIDNPEKYLEYERSNRERNRTRLQELQVARKKNISYDEYKWMVAQQDNKCAICENEETRKSRTEGNICRLTIDHNHVTGKVRELLCHNCNVLIGHSKESIELLENAIKYLRKHQ